VEYKNLGYLKITCICMEKPTYAFKDVTYFNSINSLEKHIIFSDFEHNWDLLKFLTNENKYYFCLNKNINSKYSFKVIYNTYTQQCKHIKPENVYFIIFFKEQEHLINELPIKLNFLYDKQVTSILNVEKSIVTTFNTYKYNEALKIINNTNKLCVSEEELNYTLKQNTVKRQLYEKNIFSNICFFGASVTEQQYSYVNYLINNCNDLVIFKKGYSGCHINQATWFVNDILNLIPKPKIVVLEWITSVLKPKRDELICYLDIICNILFKNNITPIFLYLYKNDINDYLDIVNIYEEVAINYNISSIFLYKVIKEINIDKTLILKDSCHTNYEGSNLYGLMIKNVMYNLFLNNNFSVKTIQKKEPLLINDNIYKKYNNIKVIPLEKLINCDDIENTIFDEKKYYKIDKDLLKILIVN